jgi:hypothetical protein
MRKPIRPSGEYIADRVAKNKTQKIHFDRAIPAGGIEKLMATVRELAEKTGCDPETFVIVKSWHGTVVRLSRTETPEEKHTRVKGNLMAAYSQRYRNWQYEQDRIKRAARKAAVASLQDQLTQSGHIDCPACGHQIT